jgi:hypothetical protein
LFNFVFKLIKYTMSNLENWLTPEVEVYSVAEETKGAGGGGPDFGSELSGPM